MNAYFWMNIEGAIFSVEVKKFYMYRGGRAMDILRDMALETGAADEILIQFERGAGGAGMNKIYGSRRQLLNVAGDSDPLRERKFPEAFLSVIKGKQGTVKYQLKGVSILSYKGGGSEGPYGHSHHGSLSLASLLLGFDKVERAAHAPSSPPR